MISGKEDSRIERALQLTREAQKHVDHAIAYAEDVQCLLAEVVDELPRGCPDKVRLTGARVDMQDAVHKLEPKRVRELVGDA